MADNLNFKRTLKDGEEFDFEKAVTRWQKLRKFLELIDTVAFFYRLLDVGSIRLILKNPEYFWVNDTSLGKIPRFQNFNRKPTQ